MPLPTPRPDQALWTSVLESGFLRFPERRANYDRFQTAQRNATLDYLPIKLDIENVSRCNFRCSMCQVSKWPKLQRAGDMSIEAWASP